MPRPARPNRLLLATAYVGFVSLGLPDTVLGVAWPSVRGTFGLDQSAVAVVLAGSSGAVLLSGLFAGRLLGAAGVGALLAGSSLLVALGTTGYALAPAWGLFAACSLLHGLGSGAIDSGLNYYAARHFSVRHMNWLHACWGLGATLGPLVMTGALVWSGDWRPGYGAVAAVLFGLTVLFVATRGLWGGPGRADEGVDAAPSVGVGEALRDPLVGLQVALFFVYTGVEATLGQWGFTVLTEARGAGPEAAGAAVTAYWASITVGRVALGAVAERVGVDRLVRLSLVAAVVGVALFALDVSYAASAASLVLTGLGFAVVFPSLMARTPARLGDARAAHAVGFQIGAATLGVAALPGLSGVLADRAGVGAVAAGALGMAVTALLLHEAVLARGRRARA